MISKRAVLPREASPIRLYIDAGESTRRQLVPDRLLTASLVVKLVAKDDTAEELAEFLAGAVELASDEAGTIV